MPEDIRVPIPMRTPLLMLGRCRAGCLHYRSARQIISPTTPISDGAESGLTEDDLGNQKNGEAFGKELNEDATNNGRLSRKHHFAETISFNQMSTDEESRKLTDGSSITETGLPRGGDFIFLVTIHMTEFFAEDGQSVQC